MTKQVQSIAPSTKKAPEVIVRPAAPERIDPGIKLENGWMHCHRTLCASRLDCAHLPPGKVVQMAEIHGFVRTRDGKWCCSARCCALEEQNPSTPVGRIVAPGPVKAQANRPDVRVRNGWIQCDREACGHQIVAPSGATQEKLNLVAETNGFTREAHGVYCSAACAKKARYDIEDGRQAKPVYQEKNDVK